MSLILTVNPGSTSTKMALFQDASLVAHSTIRHEASLLKNYPRVWDQFEFRLKTVQEWAESQTKTVDAVVGMGGLLRPLRGGTYRVNTVMLEDARANRQGEHSSNLGCAIADALAKRYGCQAFVVDPVSVDEFGPLARYSGHPLIQRSSLSHALNIHAAARRGAVACGVPLEKSNFIIAHLGGGISVAPVCGGKIVDVNDASSDGPFSPERTGGLPLQAFIALCQSRSETEMRKLVMGAGGLVAYLGTNAAQEVEQRIASGDKQAREVYEAMGYQIAKEIGAMSTVPAAKIDRIILTGGLAGSAMLTGWITERVKFIAPLLVFPGEDEMLALAEGVARVLKGEEQALEYGEHSII
jgi:butyrate kinase